MIKGTWAGLHGERRSILFLYCIHDKPFKKNEDVPLKKQSLNIKCALRCQESYSFNKYFS